MDNSISQLGSAVIGFALTLCAIRSNEHFCWALSDCWDKKRTMLACDAFSAFCSVVILALLKTNSLLPIHMHVSNVANGLMNTVQHPAGEVAVSLVIPKSQYQRTGGMRSMSSFMHLWEWKVLLVWT